MLLPVYHQKIHPMFIISLTYKVSTATVDEYIPAHVEYLKEQYAKGTFIASGRKVPRTGGIILSNAESRETVEIAITADPFYVNGVADYEITEFTPTMTSEQLNFLR